MSPDKKPDDLSALQISKNLSAVAPANEAPQPLSNKQDHTHVLQHMPVKKAVWALGIPMIISMLVQVIYNMTDTLFIGMLNEPNMVAAISICLPVTFVLHTFGNLFAIGGASFISRMLGEGNTDSASHAASISFWSTVAICLAASLLGILIIEPMLRLVGASSHTIDYAKGYMLILFYGGPFIGAQITLGGLLRSEGATKHSMFGMVLGTVLNIVLDPLFILYFDMGVKGAALATVLGNFSGFSYYILHYLRDKGIVSIGISKFTFKWHYYKEILKIGIPASLGFLLMSLAMALSNVIAASYSDNVVAAFSIVFRITSIGFMIILGLAEGTQPLMGYSYGSANYARLFETVRYSIKVSTLIGIIFTVIFYAFPEAWIRVFIKNEEVVTLGTAILRIMMISLPFLGAQMILLTLFQSIGKTVESTVVALGRQGFFLVPFLFLFTKWWGYTGFLTAEPVADIFTSILAVILYYMMKNKIVKKHSNENIVNI